MFVLGFQSTGRLLEIQNYLKFKKMKQEKVVGQDSSTFGLSRVTVAVAGQEFSSSRLPVFPTSGLPNFSDSPINLFPTLH